MKRTLMAVAAFAAMGGLTVVTGQAQPPAGGAAPTAAPNRGVAVFNVLRVMKDFTKWQYYAAEMNKKRAGYAADLGKTQEQMARLQDDMRKADPKDKATQDRITQQLVAMNREFEDKERHVKKLVDDESGQYLRQLFAEIKTAVDAIATSNGFTIVLAYPDALTDEDKKTMAYVDMKMRTTAAMPFYVAPSCDITPILVETLNKHFPSPGKPDPAYLPGPGNQTAGGPAGGVTPTGGTGPGGPPRVATPGGQ